MKMVILENTFIQETGIVHLYGISSKTFKSTAFRVAVTLPLKEAKKIKYLPIDARFAWKCSQEGGIASYEEGVRIPK